MTLTKPTLPAVVVVLLVLSPLALITPWVFVLVAPFALVAMLVFGVPSLAAREVIKEKTPEGPELMCLEGLQDEPEVAERIRAELQVLFKDTPAANDPVACACVKREGDHWLGVLRMRTTEGHSYAQMEGATAAEAGTKMAETLHGYQAKFPILQPEPVSYQECQNDCCHLGRQSIFYIDRDKYGRSKARKGA